LNIAHQQGLATAGLGAHRTLERPQDLECPGPVFRTKIHAEGTRDHLKSLSNKEIDRIGIFSIRVVQGNIESDFWRKQISNAGANAGQKVFKIEIGATTTS
jgi:hypothetical protein